jgi:hypothetical protein
VCLLNPAGAILGHQHVKASPETCLTVMTPARADLVVAVDCLFTWSWGADLWAREGIAFVLGPALSRPAIHGGKAKHDRIEAQKLAVLLRGGMRPQAAVSPAAMRATRDLLRRRVQLRRQRAELLTPIQHTKSQDNRPESGQKLADQANRDGVAERLAAPAVQPSSAVDLTRIGHDAERRRDLELSILTAATQRHRHTRSLLRPVPGLGELLSLVRSMRCTIFRASHGARMWSPMAV